MASEVPCTATMPHMASTPSATAHGRQREVRGTTRPERRHTDQDGPEDAVLMGCSADQSRDVMHAIVASLENPYKR